MVRPTFTASGKRQSADCGGCASSQCLRNSVCRLVGGGLCSVFLPPLPVWGRSGALSTAAASRNAARAPVWTALRCWGLLQPSRNKHGHYSLWPVVQPEWVLLISLFYVQWGQSYWGLEGRHPRSGVEAHSLVPFGPASSAGMCLTLGFRGRSVTLEQGREPALFCMKLTPSSVLNPQGH